MARQIVLDTETTGLEPELNHRVIEIGCVELVNRRATGRTFHRYLNPEREIDDGALSVHGISRTDLDEQPRARRSEEHTSELQSRSDLVCRLLLEKKKKSEQKNNSHVDST